MESGSYDIMIDLADVDEAGESAEAIVALLDYIREEVETINPLAADLIGLSIMALRDGATRLV